MSTLSLKGPRWASVCRLVKERDGGLCVECGTDDNLSVDHVVPLASFTEEDWAAERQYDETNLQTLCTRCNGRKAHRTQVRQDWRNPRWLDRL